LTTGREPEEKTGVWKPDTSKLRSAIDKNGTWTVAIDDDARIVVEWPDSWRNTKVLYLIKLKDNADVWMYEPSTKAWTILNYRTGPAAGIKFLVPDRDKTWR
jgi:hypothetical protein